MAITAEYQDYLKSDKWKTKRRKVLNRAGYTCEICKRRQAWQVHHLTYDNLRDKFGVMGNEPISDLQAVCGQCHQEIHGLKSRKRGRLWGSLGRVLARVIG